MASLKGLKQGLGNKLDDLMSFGHLQTVFQVPFQQRCDQKDLFTFHTTNKTVSELCHDVMLFRVGFHMLPNIITANVGVLKNGAHFTKLLLKIMWDVDIHFHICSRLMTLTLSRVLLTSVANESL